MMGKLCEHIYTVDVSMFLTPEEGALNPGRSNGLVVIILL
jgi:hypothetical protein